MHINTRQFHSLSWDYTRVLIARAPLEAQAATLAKAVYSSLCRDYDKKHGECEVDQVFPLITAKRYPYSSNNCNLHQT